MTVPSAHRVPLMGSRSLTDTEIRTRLRRLQRTLAAYGLPMRGGTDEDGGRSRLTVWLSDLYAHECRYIVETITRRGGKPRPFWTLRELASDLGMLERRK